MYRTYQMYKRLVKPDYDNMSLEQLAMLYQQPNSNKTRIFATVFCRCFSLMLKKTNPYTMLTLQEKASKMTEKLHRVLSQYKKGKGLFLTVFGQAIENTMNSGSHYVKADKRLIWLYTNDYTTNNMCVNNKDNCVNHPAIVNNYYGFDKLSNENVDPLSACLRTKHQCDMDLQNMEFFNALRNSELFPTDAERKACECLYNGYNTLKDLSNMLCMKSKDVKKLREDMKKKLIASGRQFY